MIRPAWLSPPAAAAWDAIAPRLRDADLLTPLDEIALTLFCSAYGHYRRALAEARASDDPHRTRLLEKISEEQRIHAREMAATFLLIPELRVPLAALNTEGVDAELARWFDPDGGPLVPVERPVSLAEFAARMR